MPTEIFGVIAPILIIAGIGYLLERGKVGLQHETMSTLVMMVGTPALVFSALTSTVVPNSALLAMSGGAVLVVIVGGVLSLAVLKALGLSVRTFLPSLTMPNSGNIGLPCVLLAFGQDGLAVGVAFFFVIAMIQYTVMPIISQGFFSVRNTLRQPLVWSVVCVLISKLLNISPPDFVADTTRILGGMMIPVMVILLGGSLARLGVGDISLSIKLATIRLVIGVVSGAVVVWMLGVEGLAAGTLFLLTSMPTAIITYVFAERFDRSPDKVAGLIVASTLMTFAALPVLLWIAVNMAGTGPA